jgi:hypothetical protein
MLIDRIILLHDPIKTLAFHEMLNYQFLND